jgi:death-on-curing protein
MPIFLTRPQVERLHDQALIRWGGSEGIRDSGLIDSALAPAQNAYWYGLGDEFDIAAAYAFHIAESQAFVDGNKRAGVATALTFLEVNGRYRRPDEEEFYQAMIAVAEKRMDKADLAGYLRRLGTAPT